MIKPNSSVVKNAGPRPAIKNRNAERIAVSGEILPAAMGRFFFPGMQRIFLPVGDIVEQIHTRGDATKRRECQNRIDELGGNEKIPSKDKTCKNESVFRPLLGAGGFEGTIAMFTSKVPMNMTLLNPSVLNQFSSPAVTDDENIDQSG